MTCADLLGGLAARRERGAGGVGLAGRLAVLGGFVGARGMAGPGPCCVMRRVRSAWGKETKGIEQLLSCGTDNQNESPSGKVPGVFPGGLSGKRVGKRARRTPSKTPRTVPGRSGQLSWGRKSPGVRERGLGGFLAAATMVIAGPLLRRSA